jgi:aminoglycoside 2'-N-acetyltransferase I
VLRGPRRRLEAHEEPEGIGRAVATIRRLRTDALDPALERRVRALLDAAFRGGEEGDFTEDDWKHSIRGLHFLLEDDGDLVGHASVVERSLEVAGRPLRTGYVEAVAIAPDRQRQGLGTRLMRDVNAWIAEGFELGGLGTGSVSFYERLGWQRWQGPTGIRTEAGFERTPDDDGYILVLLTPSSPPLSLGDPISCEWRPGDSW